MFILLLLFLAVINWIVVA